MKMYKKGFTLIEMLVVIAIIAVLVSIIVPVVGNSTKKAEAATDAANLRNVIATATIDYLANDGASLTVTNPPSCKSVDGATIEVWKVGEELKAFFVSGTDYYGVEEFSDVADGTVDTLAKATAPTAATGTKLYPTT